MLKLLKCAVVCSLFVSANAMAEQLAATSDLPAALLSIGGQAQIMSASAAHEVRGQGSTLKLDGLSGYTFNFSEYDNVVGVWVKSGSNLSGDGSGYGEYFDTTKTQSTGSTMITVDWDDFLITSALDISNLVFKFANGDNGNGDNGNGDNGNGDNGNGGNGNGNGNGFPNGSTVLTQTKEFSLTGATLARGSSVNLLEGLIGTISASSSSNGTNTSIDALFGGLSGSVNVSPTGINFDLGGKALQETLNLQGGQFNQNFSQFFQRLR